MKKKRGKKIKFLEILNSKPVIGALIFIMLSLVTVLAGDVIVKEGSMDIGDDFNASGVLFVDSNSNKVGIGTASPDAMLDVGGAIVSAQKSVSSDTDALGVAGVNSVLIATTSNDVTIGGLANGVTGQIVHLVKATSTNTAYIEHNEGTGTQKILTPDAVDIQLDTYGGVTLIYSGSYWYVAAEGL